MKHRIWNWHFWYPISVVWIILKLSRRTQTVQIAAYLVVNESNLERNAKIAMKLEAKNEINILFEEKHTAHT